MIDYLELKESQQKYKVYRGDIIYDYFAILDLNKDGVYSYESETRMYNDAGLLRDFKRFAPGSYNSIDVTGKDFESFRYPNGFIPDFTKGPIKIQNNKHTLLGNTVLETYLGELSGRSVAWVFARDRQGRIWIDRIYFPGADINTYGVYEEVINSGALTNKPLEYRSQVGRVDAGFYRDFDSTYVDITPLISRLLPVKLYRDYLQNRKTGWQQEFIKDQVQQLEIYMRVIRVCREMGIYVGDSDLSTLQNKIIIELVRRAKDQGLDEFDGTIGTKETVFGVIKRFNEAVVKKVDAKVRLSD